MRISTDSISNSLIQQIQTLGQQQTQEQQALSTGLSVINPSDNPVVVGQVLDMGTQMQELQQYSKNNSAATQVAQQSYSSLSTLQSISTTANQLAENGASGTTSSTSYTAYVQQLDQMISQGLNTANSQFNGAYIFGGTQTTKPPFTATYDASGNITGVTYTGTAAGASVQTSQSSTVSPYTDGTTNQHIADFLNNLISLKNAMSSQSTSAVQGVQSSLQTSENNILSAVSGVGAVQSGLEADESLNQSAFTALQGLVSTDTSADIATTTVKLSQTQAAYQAALESGAKIMQTSLLNYLN